MRTILFILLLDCSLMGSAQSVNTRLGGRAAAMGYASFSIADEAAFFNNVGALAQVPQSNAFFCYDLATEIPGANRTGASFSVITPVVAAALGFFRFGDPIYNEQMLSAAIGNRIGNTSLGVKMNYVQYYAEGFGTRNTISVDLGVLTKITPEVSVGAGILNVTQAKIAENEELPIVLAASLGFQPDLLFLFIVEAEKRIGSPVLIKGGVEYCIYRKLFIRTGFNLNPTSLFGGLGVRTHRISMDYAMKFSQHLGFAHQASASFCLRPSRLK